MDTIASMAVSRVLNHGPRAAGAYLAHHPKTEEPVVLKLHGGSLDKPVWGARVQSVRKLKDTKASPSIAYPRGMPNDKALGQLVAWEYIDGPLLSEVLPNMSPAQGDAALLEITRTLAALHQHGVFHGGVHLGQFRMREDTPVLLDTGWFWNTSGKTPVLAEDVKALKSLAGAMSNTLSRPVWQCVRMSSLDLSETVKDIEAAIREEEVTPDQPDIAALFASPVAPAAASPQSTTEPNTQDEPDTDTDPDLEDEGQEPDTAGESQTPPAEADELVATPEPDTADEPTEAENTADEPTGLEELLAGPDTDDELRAGSTAAATEEIAPTEPYEEPPAGPVDSEDSADDTYTPDAAPTEAEVSGPTETGETTTDDTPVRTPDRETETDHEPGSVNTNGGDEKTDASPEIETAPKAADKKQTPKPLSWAAKLRPRPISGATAAATTATRNYLGTTRGRIAAGALALLLLVGGIAAFSITGSNSDDTAPQHTISNVTNQAETTPRGYLPQSEWTIPIPDKGRVFAANPAAVTLTSKTLTLYSTNDGAKIREVKLNEPVEYISETTIGDEPGIVWRTGKTLHAWTEKIGEKGEIIDAELGDKATVSDNGDKLLIVTDGQPATLDTEGLVDLSRDGDLTPMAVDAEGLVSGGFDTPVHITDMEGSTRSVNLKPPQDGHRIHSWITAGHGHTATLWAADPESTDPKQEVTMAIHDLESGEITAQITKPYEDLKPDDLSTKENDGLRWITGQGALTATYGNYVFSLRDGTFVTELPGEFDVTKVKGSMVVAENDDQTHIFRGTEDGYPMRSSLIAETPSTAILQEGRSLVGYGSSQV